MLRREAISIIAGAGLAVGQSDPKPLAHYFANVQGTALLIDIATRKVLAVHHAPAASGASALPGSTVKPFTLSALLSAGKLTAAESFLCPSKLTIASHQLNCSHPVLSLPMRAETALAYSCNCFVAHMAERLRPEELVAELEGAGFASGVRRAASLDSLRLQSLGESNVLATAASLAMAYRALALRALPPVLAGLEGAVEYGTAHFARVAGVKAAGKTGSVRGPDGVRTAWFAGFLPSRNAEIVATVMLHGDSGGSDAAPIAGRILDAWYTRRL
jgi:membrane peptidoglycan carboxypeptidase